MTKKTEDMTTPKHTPTPWKRSGANTIHGPDCIVAFVGGTEREVKMHSGERWEADAVHIVRCVNSHDELVAALADIREEWLSDEPQMGRLVDAIPGLLARARGGA